MPKLLTKSTKKGHQQYAALPVRLGKSGELEVLLLTSRGSGRWVLPKGWPMPGLSPAQAAMTEAYEEAGLKGRIVDANPIGQYHYDKRMNVGAPRTIEVDLFVLEVSHQLPTWPEQAERVTRWYGPEEAATMVAEPELAAILASLRRLLSGFGAGTVQPAT